MIIQGTHVVFYKYLSTLRSKTLAVLLSKRTQDAPYHVGYWGLFGGSVEKGENPEGALIREITEEIEAGDYLLSLVHLCDVSVTRGDKDKIGVAYFECPLDVKMTALSIANKSDDGKIESDGLAWFTAEEIHHLMIRPEDRIAISKFFEKHGV